MNTPPPLAPAPVAGHRLVAVLGTVAMISGLLIVLVYHYTLPTITRHKEEALRRALLKVIPGTSSVRGYVVAEKDLLPATKRDKRGVRVYAGYDAHGELTGIAAEGAAQGYADAVRVLYGYSPACQCITGLHLVSSRETPGFGDKLGTDPAFLANFERLDAALNAAQDGLANAIVTVRHGTKTRPWQIDAISGATVSSRAVGRALNDSASKVAPVVTAQLEQLRRGGNR